MFLLVVNVCVFLCVILDMCYLLFIWLCDDLNMEFDDSSLVFEIKDD